LLSPTDPWRYYAAPLVRTVFPPLAFYPWRLIFPVPSPRPPEVEAEP